MKESDSFLFSIVFDSNKPIKWESITKSINNVMKKNSDQLGDKPNILLGVFLSSILFSLLSSFRENPLSFAGRYIKKLSME